MQHAEEIDRPTGILQWLATNLGHVLVSLFIPAVTFAALWRVFIFLRDSQAP